MKHSAPTHFPSCQRSTYHPRFKVESISYAFDSLRLHLIILTNDYNFCRIWETRSLKHCFRVLGHRFIVLHDWGGGNTVFGIEMYLVFSKAIDVTIQWSNWSQLFCCSNFEVSCLRYFEIFSLLPKIFLLKLYLLFTINC